MRREHFGDPNARDWCRSVTSLSRCQKANAFEYKSFLDFLQVKIDLDVSVFGFSKSNR